MEHRRLKVMIDTNVLLDVMCPDNRPSTETSTAIFRAIKKGVLEGELSTQSIVDAAYVASRTEGKELLNFKQKVQELRNYINIGGIDQFSLFAAVQKGTGDFEDDVQYEHAYDSGCDVLLTNDKEFIKHYAKKEVPIKFLTPEEFLAKLQA